jgi:hypothetical protein
MQERQISVLIVVDTGKKVPLGMIHLYELLERGLA